MSYTSLITYDVYDLNSSLFLEIIRELLQSEFVKQRSKETLQFLPKTVSTDTYLLSPIADKEIDPAYCSIIKAKMNNTEYRFANQQNESNSYVIGILANGLTNLRKIGDAIYEILNDMSVKNYLFALQNSNGENLISDSGQYYISELSTEYEISKTMNDKNIVYSHLILNAQIAEVPKENTFTEIESVTTDLKLGTDKTKLTQTTDLT